MLSRRMAGHDVKDQKTIVEDCYEGWLGQMFDVFFEASIDDWTGAWDRLQNGLCHAKKCRDALCGLGESLELRFSQGASMAIQKTKMKMTSASKGKGAVMPSVTWSTLSAGIQFVVVDNNGTPVGPIDPTTVATTLAVQDGNGNPSTLATVATGANSLSYTISRTPSTGIIALVATLTYNAGTPGPFGANLPIVLDALAPGAPTDLQLTISGN